MESEYNFNSIYSSVPEIGLLTDRQTSDAQQSDLIMVLFFLKRYGTLKNKNYKHAISVSFLFFNNIT